MAKRKGYQEQKPLTALERLGLRVSAMINSPRAQLERTVTIHRLDTDADEDWLQVVDLLGETDGIALVHNEVGTVTLRWDLVSEDDRVIERDEVVVVDEEPAPF